MQIHPAKEFVLWVRCCIP